MNITSFRNAEILFDTHEQLIEQINELNYLNILSITTGCPKSTTTLNCVNVYYEYYVN